MKWTRIRFLLAEFVVQILAFIFFCIAGVAWLYFSTIYAAIVVIVVGVILGAYVYTVIENENKN